MLPVARSGNSTAFHATMNSVATFTSAAAPVQSVATRTGAVTLTHTDITDWAATLAPYAPLASPTFTGTPSLPTGATGITQTAGTSNTTLATTAFVGTALGSYAPLASPIFTGDARAVTPAYGDNDTSVATTAFVQSAAAPAANNAGRNLVTNGTFVVAQRGAGAFSASGYTLDRWQMAFGGGTLSVSQNPANDTIRGQIGDETAQSLCSVSVAGTSGAGDFAYLVQKTENVLRLSGKTVTVSFWAAASSGTPKIGVSFDQLFGTGGSPSTTVSGTGQSVTLSTTYQRFSLTFAIPSAAGKTLGTNNDHCTQLDLWFSSGATNNPRAGNIGVQTAGFGIWGIQLEIGTQATALDAGGTPQQILAEAQRFFVAGVVDCNQTPQASGIYTQMVFYPVTMRASPTVAFSGTSYGNASAIAAYNVGVGFAKIGATAGAAGASYFTSNYTASADL